MDENIKKLLEQQADAQQMLEDTALEFVKEIVGKEKHAQNMETMVWNILAVMRRHIKLEDGNIIVDADGLTIELGMHSAGANSVQDVILRIMRPKAAKNDAEEEKLAEVEENE